MVLSRMYHHSISNRKRDIADVQREEKVKVGGVPCNGKIIK